MAWCLVAIHHPDDYDGSTEDVAMTRDIDRLNVSVEDVHVLEQLADRADDVRDVEVACGHLMEHRRKEKKVLAVNERYFDICISCDRPVKFQCGVHSAEPASEDHYSFLI